MTTGDWLMVAAVLLSPLVAVQATRWVDAIREQRLGRMHLFRVLMATRATGLSQNHVEALNLIDIAFDRASGKDRKIIEAWRAYHTHLNDRSPSVEHWGAKRMDLLVDLLYEMSARLGYSFDKTHVRTSVYAPVAHAEVEDNNLVILKCLRELLEGRRVLPMHITNPPAPPQAEPETEEERLVPV